MYRYSILLVKIAVAIFWHGYDECQVARTHLYGLLTWLGSGQSKFRAKHWLEFVLQKLRLGVCVKADIINRTESALLPLNICSIYLKTYVWTSRL